MIKLLVIQTAFTGDVVLATSVLEKLHEYYPGARIDFLLRKGNEGLLQNHPYITNLLIWDKTKQKKRNLIKMALHVRRQQYTHVINIHRFFTSGFVTFLSGAPYRAGFAKNPWAFCFTLKAPHIISPSGTERPVLDIERNQLLIAPITDDKVALPVLYPSAADREYAAQYMKPPFVCIAPSSVWYTKRLPVPQWISMINGIPAHYHVYILGAPSDKELGETISNGTTHPKTMNLCGKLNFLQSAALMQHADMNYANDSAPMHFANAMKAPLTAVYCSTAPSYGFGPLLDSGKVAEIREDLYCRPCGIHGHKKCPEGHFRCALEITNEDLLWWIPKTI